MKKTIPLFFAADNNYLPFLAVALESVKANASRAHDYIAHILHTGINSENARKIQGLQSENFKVKFVDVAEKLGSLAENLQLRDYYTCATYYRLFIADMFPELDKALYLDSDTVILGDISELFSHELGDNLVGAIPDETVLSEPVFCKYVSDALGIPPEKYFNAGILLMNLKKFREERFFQSFNALLGKYKFSVAQDQDYLNVLCRNRVAYISPEWNKMPIEPPVPVEPKLVHYNLTRKPWHYANILYCEHFWEYAEKTEFYDDIMKVKRGFTKERAQADAECEKRLIELAAFEAANPANYYRTYAAI